MNFKRPTTAERIKAIGIGSTKGLPETLRKTLTPSDDFEPIPIPKPGDCLAEHHENGQTFDGFAKSTSNRPDKTRNKIYLQPSGHANFTPACRSLSSVVWYGSTTSSSRLSTKEGCIDASLLRRLLRSCLVMILGSALIAAT